MARKPVERLQIPVGEAHTTAALDLNRGAFAGMLVLAHGAGGHMDHPMMTALADRLCGCGLVVVRFNFLYRAAGQGPPDRMPRLQSCFEAVVRYVRTLNPPRLLIGGHSMGGRVASLLAADGLDCDGALLLAYPLHPAGKPQQLRAAHLHRITVPVLSCNGTRDALCRQELLDPILDTLPRPWTHHWLPEADHSYTVTKRSGRTQHDVLAEIERHAAHWLATLPALRS